jgi:hypothetical protein
MVIGVALSILISVGLHQCTLKCPDEAPATCQRCTLLVQLNSYAYLDVISSNMYGQRCLTIEKKQQR